VVSKVSLCFTAALIQNHDQTFGFNEILHFRMEFLAIGPNKLCNRYHIKSSKHEKFLWKKTSKIAFWWTVHSLTIHRKPFPIQGKFRAENNSLKTVYRIRGKVQKVQA